ncbi:MAG: hypothetical protein FWG72_03230 [Oscillospiraceae bacterium]|nr:hypothetical protein [Oscillospiraceae bacterium]
MTLLSVAVASLLAVALMGSVWLMYYTGRSEPFQLPPPLSPESPAGPSGPGPGLGGLAYAPLTVDGKNIQALLATIQRPDAYRQTVDIVSFLPGGEERMTHDWARRGGLTRVETQQRGFPAQNRIFTESLVHVWTGETMPVYEVAPKSADAEALSGVPTWETVAALPPESILSAEYLYLPVERERCLLVRTREPAYLGEYLISLETGLLLRAAFTGEDGLLAYEVTAGPPVLGDPGDERFMLPDGNPAG